MMVLKIGGDIYRSGLSKSLLGDIEKLSKKDKIVIVHGGGDEVTNIAEKLGKKQIFITSPSGIKSRYTDEETVKIYSMVMTGRVNKSIVQWLSSQGVPSVGLSGIDANIIKAKRKKRLLIIDDRRRKRIIDGGYTGSITKINKSFLFSLLDDGYIPVIAPIALGEDNEILNVDSDRAAAYVAGSLDSERVIFLTDVEGILLNGECLRDVSLEDAKILLNKVGPGMDKKVLASIEALNLNVGEAIISSGFIEKPLTRALNHDVGTVIKNGK